MTPVRAIWVIGLAGLALRLWMVQVQFPTCAQGVAQCRARFGDAHYAIGGDAVYNHEQANLIADGHWFVDPFSFLDGHVVDSAGHPPLYSLFLSMWSWVGLDSVNDHRVVSTLCGLAVVVLIGLLTRRIAGDLAGVVAAAIAAVHPLIWINDLMLLTEGLYQVLVVVVLWTAYDWIERPDRRRAAVIGAAIAFAALTRGEAVALFAFLVLPLVLRARTVDRGEKVRQIAVCWVAGLAVMAPWITWNMVRFEEPVLISSSTGAVLMAGSCDEVWSGERMGLWDDCFSARELWDEFDAEFPGAFLTGDDLVIYDESVRDNWDRKQATEYILDNWTRYPTVAAARIGRSLELFRVSHTLRKNYQLEGRWAEPSTVGLGIYYGLVPLAVIGALVLRRSGRRLSPLLAMWATVMFASATAFGLTRYRVPVDLAMIVLGATAISWLWERLRTPDRGASI